jgi:hypothetical protein
LSEYERPKWNPRASRFKIARLYNSDAAGIYDEELVDEIGITILCRIEDCLKITKALVVGEIDCPRCDSAIKRQGQAVRPNNELLKCASCAWELPWSEYHKSIGKKHLQSAGLKTFFEEYVSSYPMAKNYKQKILLIDQVLHRYHWELEGTPSGPSAVNLIGGSREEVLAFLNQLSYGPRGTEGMSETKVKWLEKLNYSGFNKDNIDNLNEKHPWV